MNERPSDPRAGCLAVVVSVVGLALMCGLFRLAWESAGAVGAGLRCAFGAC